MTDQSRIHPDSLSDEHSSINNHHMQQSWIVLDDNGSGSWTPSHSRPATASPVRPMAGRHSSMPRRPASAGEYEADHEEDDDELKSRRLVITGMSGGGMDRDVRVALELAERSFLLGVQQQLHDESSSVTSRETVPKSDDDMSIGSNGGGNGIRASPTAMRLLVGRPNKEGISTDSEHYAFQDFARRPDTPMSLMSMSPTNGSTNLSLPTAALPAQYSSPQQDDRPKSRDHASRIKEEEDDDESSSFWQWAASLIGPPTLSSAFSHILFAIIAVYVDRKFFRPVIVSSSAAQTHHGTASSNGGGVAGVHTNSPSGAVGASA